MEQTNELTLNDYQNLSRKYRLPTYDPFAVVFGLGSEGGEFLGVYQKFTRGDFDIHTAQEKAKKEAGDILWHIAQWADDNGTTLEEIAKINLNKLEDRMQRNMIKGDGDDR